MASDFNSASVQIGSEVHELASIIEGLAHRLRDPEQRRIMQKEIGPIYAANNALVNVIWELGRPEIMEAAE